jgi:hypothetical protein
MKLLEDCGYQYNVVTPGQVTAGALEKEKYRVLILDRTISMSDTEAAAIRRFVEQGGTVIADYLTGILDEHGKGREKGGALDDLFGIKRDESKGYLDGKTIAEINGERYSKPFLQRLAYDGAPMLEGVMPIYERGLKGAGAMESVGGADVLAEKQTGKGRAFYFNLTPVAYTDLTWRQGDAGAKWRSYIGQILEETCGLPQRAAAKTGGKPVALAESLLWRKGDTVVLAVVKNPPREAAVDSAGKIEDVFGEPIDVEISLAKPATGIRNLRTGEKLPDGAVIKARWQPWEALVFEMKSP